MLKPVWVGKKLGENLGEKDVVSKSAPLLLDPAAGADPVPPFVPMVWDLTATTESDKEKLKLAAENISQMVRENPARGLLLLQSLPKDADARKTFIDAVTIALKGTSWKIAVDDAPLKSVLTLFNEVHLDGLNPPELANPAAKPNFAAAQSHRVDWFSLKTQPNQCYCVGNMQYQAGLSAEQIKADYCNFDSTFYFRDNYDPNAGNDFRSIFAGALGKAPTANQGVVFTHADKVATTSSIIISDDLIDPAAATTTPRHDYNRRDAAIYPGETGFTADDMWEGSDITKVWSARGFHNMTTCDNTYTFPAETLESIKAGPTQKPLCIFGEVIPSEMLGTEQSKNYLENIVKNTLQTFKNSFPGKNATQAALPTKIKLNIPIHKGDHFSLLGIEITIDPEKFANFINGDPNVSINSSDYITNTSAVLIGSKRNQDFPDGSPEKTAIETQLNAVFKPANQPAIQIRNITPFLQFGTHPDAPGVDCGPITAEQGIRFFNDKGLLRVETKYNGNDFPDVLTWNGNAVWGEPGDPSDPDADPMRKQYAAESFRIGLELRRKFLQLCGAGAAPDKVEVEAEKSKLSQRGYNNPDKLARIRESGIAYKQLIGAVKKYEDKGKQVVGQLPNSNEPTVLYSRNDKGNKLSAKKSSQIIADLMMYDLFSKGYETVTISTSPHNEAMFRDAALRAGFKFENIKFGEVKDVSAAKNEQAQNIQPDFANLMNPR